MTFFEDNYLNDDFLHRVMDEDQIVKTEKVIDETGFENLKKSVKEKLNFDSYQYSNNFLKRRFIVRLNANQIKSYQEYKELFEQDINEQAALKKNLTIHVTEFFRDKSMWDYCKDDFFPKVLDLYKHKGKINIWSAGCSTGQEAISILITFLEINPDLINKIKINCTDISVSTIHAAELAEYDEMSIKGMPQNLLEKYFDKKEDNYSLKFQYRGNLNYKLHDILQDQPLDNMDIIFFRNTVIYFSIESKDILYKKLYTNMNTPSFLILGKTETLTGGSREFFGVYNSIERIFDKK